MERFKGRYDVVLLKFPYHRDCKIISFHGWYLWPRN